MNILLDDLTHTSVQTLLRVHVEDMLENSPKESSYALDLSGLKAADFSFWTAWENDQLLGCCALKELNPTSGEIKSMRTHGNHMRKGIAARMLEHIIATARSRGYSLLSLETGTGPVFEPALHLYKKYGFEGGEPFSDYRAGPFNQFFHLHL